MESELACVQPEKPLTISSIVSSCFRNPSRLNYPNFPLDVASQDYFDLCLEFDSEVNFLALVNSLIPKNVSRFDAMEIKLDDQSALHKNFENLPNSQLVDQELYLDTIKNCKWCGPYRSNGEDNFAFYSIAESGENDYFAVLELYLDERVVKGGGLSFFMNNWKIRDQILF